MVRPSIALQDIGASESKRDADASRRLSQDAKKAKEIKARTQELQQSTRVQLELLVDGLYMQAFIFVLIIIDIVLAFTTDEHEVLAVTITILLIFTVEISARFYAYGWHRFVTSWLDMLDCFVVFLSIVFTILNMSHYTGFVLIARASRILRILRFVRVFTRCFKTVAKAPKSLRNTVRQNKQGYRDAKYDLDLVYITDNIIAMSIPGDGARALFRNPSSKVAEFLNEKHPNSYMIFNLCQEQHYNPAAFEGRVRNHVFEDHSVPTLNRILQVSKEVTEFLDKDKENVVVIHCRGGKGRTGTIVCSVLLDRYRLSSPEEVLEHFEEMRTNYFGEKKQGLSTPSQERYVRYFYDLVRKDHPERAFDEPGIYKTDCIAVGPMYTNNKIRWELKVTIVGEDGINAEKSYTFRPKAHDGLGPEVLDVFGSFDDSEFVTIDLHESDYSISDMHAGGGLSGSSYDSTVSYLDVAHMEDARLETLTFWSENDQTLHLEGNLRFELIRYSKKKKVKFGNVWLNTTMSPPDDNGFVIVKKEYVDSLHKDVKCKKVAEDFCFKIRADKTMDLSAFEQDHFSVLPG